MAGEVWLDDEGYRLVDSNAKQQYICDNCPCGCPAEIQLTLANIDICLGCVGDGPRWFNNINFSANGVYTLPAEGPFFPGRYSLTIEDAITYDEHNQDDCNSLVGSVTTAMFFEVQISCPDANNGRIEFVGITGGPGSLLEYDRTDDPNAPKFLGDALPTQIACGSPPNSTSVHIGHNGTALVELP